MPSRLFNINNHRSPTINPVLAKEIGLPQSVILQDIDDLCFKRGIPRDSRIWCAINNKLAGALWLWLGKDALDTCYRSLIDKKLIFEASYKVMEKDSTRYFAVNYVACAKLKGVTVIQVESQDKPAPMKLTSATLFENNKPPVAEKPESYEERFKRVFKEGLFDCCAINYNALLDRDKRNIDKDAEAAYRLFRSQLCPGKTAEQIKERLLIFHLYHTTRKSNGSYFTPPTINQVVTDWPKLIKFIQDECGGQMPDKAFFEQRKNGHKR